MICPALCEMQRALALNQKKLCIRQTRSTYDSTLRWTEPKDFSKTTRQDPHYRSRRLLHLSTSRYWGTQCIETHYFRIRRPSVLILMLTKRCNALSFNDIISSSVLVPNLHGSIRFEVFIDSQGGERSKWIQFEICVSTAFSVAF